jgi:kumamolisin
MRCSSIVAFVLPVLASLACARPSVEDGVPRAKSLYVDLGNAPEEARVRALVGLKVHDRAGLDALAADVSDPKSPRFRKFLKADEANERFAPSEADVDALRDWAKGQGIDVVRTTKNRLFVEITGSVASFNRSFATRLHLYEHDDKDFRVYGTPDGITMPDVPALATLASLDVLVEEAAEAQPKEKDPGAVPDIGLVPEKIAAAYGFDRLRERGHAGKGSSIGIVVGGGVRRPDIDAFWKAFGVAREAPAVRSLMEPPPANVLEATFDVEWAGVLAPAAKLVVFQGPDTRTTSLLFAFGEAVTSGEVDVVTDSFAHREETEPAPTRALYDLAAELGAVIGTTTVAATGDSAKPDIPATCPFVTGVGGTTLTFKNGELSEEAWGRSGSGISTFSAPEWQREVLHGEGRRAACDVALNAGTAYASVYKGEWKAIGGTSVASPVFAAMIAVIDGARRTEGLPPVGFLNRVLYTDSGVQAAFRDVVSGGTAAHAAEAGWDRPSGWGAPRGDALLDALR